MIRLFTRWPCTSLYLALLAVIEPAMIAALVMPYPASTRDDWLLAALVLAPLGAGAAFLGVVVPLRITASVTGRIRRTGRN